MNNALGLRTTNADSWRIHRDPQIGIALVTVLWVMAILLVIVFSFSYMARTETLSILSFTSAMERKLIAEAGIERGIEELFYRNTYKNQNVELEDKEVWKTDGTPYKGKLGNGYYTVRITDDSGKIDVNNMTDASAIIFKNLLLNSGVSGEDADIITDSVLDWIDTDDLVRLHGAENDYYQSLPNPYKAKNAPIDTLEELLLVKGMTPEILYGGKDKKGLIDFLTLGSQGGSQAMININAAPKEVLMALPGMTPEMADGIISFRQTKEITNIGEVQGLTGANGGQGGQMSQYMTTGDSNLFTIEASGYKENGKGVYSITARVMITGDNTYKYLYYKSPSALKD
jgi:general secretion pathway protein K